MSSPDFFTRVATPRDAGQLDAIYAHYVRDTAITFEYDVPSISEFATRIHNTLSFYPWVVAEAPNGTLLGYAYAGPFHARPAYDWAVETSIYVDNDVRRLGLGTALHNALLQSLQAMGITNMEACIAVTNHPDEHLGNASVDFHHKLGYRMVGRFEQCGYKFRTWYDMVWMERIIGQHMTDQPAVRPFLEVANTVGALKPEA